MNTLYDGLKKSQKEILGIDETLRKKGQKGGM